MSLLSKSGSRSSENTRDQKTIRQVNARREPRRTQGLLDLLTTEQREKALTYGGPENHGPDGLRIDRT